MHVGEDEERLGSRVGDGGQAAFFLKCGRRYGKAFRAIVTIVARADGADETGPQQVALREGEGGADGRIVTLRAIEPGDAPALRRAFAELSPVSRYRRFQRDVAEMTEEMASYLTHVDGRSHLAWIALSVSPDLKDERIVGVARAIRLAADSPKTPDVAEIADLGRLGEIALSDHVLVPLGEILAARGDGFVGLDARRVPRLVGFRERSRRRCPSSQCAPSFFSRSHE